jgi:glycosyltransferase involved in cell wall biosynthesis
MNRAPSSGPLPEQPLLSVILPSYNQGAFIRQAIQSCLEQDYRPIEILVVDGASRDGTLEVLRDCAGFPEVRWISEPDSGPVEAVNKGLALASGAIGLIQSADDQSVPGAFRAAVEAFRGSTDLGLVYGDMEGMDAGGRRTGTVDVGTYSLLRLLSRRTWVPQPCGFFRLDLARRLGGWDERFPYCPDTDLWFRLALSSSVVKLPRVLGRTRTHEGQRDRRTREIYASYERMVRESEPLAHASRTRRRALRAGLEALKVRYNPGLTDGQVCRALWTAVWLHPPLLFGPTLPKHRMIPGYFRMAGMAGAFLRRIGWSRGRTTGRRARP